MKLLSILTFAIFALPCALQSQSFTVHNYSVPEGLPSSEIYKVYQDKKGFLWFATDNGVAKYDGYEIETFHMNNGLSDPVVFGFYEDSKERLWFRSFSGKLSYYKDGIVTRFTKSEALNKSQYQIPYALYVSPDDEISIAGKEFNIKIDSSGRLTSNETEPYTITIDSIGDTYLMSSNLRQFRQDFIKLNGKSFLVHTSDSVFQNHVNVVKWRNRLYVSLNNDLFRYDTTAMTKVFTARTHIITLNTDSKGNLWMGYISNGVQRFSDESFANPWSPSFLKNKSVTSLLTDHEGGLWFTTLENGAYFVPNLVIEQLPTESKVRTVVSSGNRIFTGDVSGSIIAYDNVSKKVIKSINIGEPVLAMYVDDRKSLWAGSSNATRVLDTMLNVHRALNTSSISFSDNEKGEVIASGGSVLKVLSASGKYLDKKSLRVVYRAMMFDDSLFYMACRIGMHICDVNMNVLQIPENLANVKISNFLKLNDSTLLITTIGGGFFVYNKINGEYTSYNARHNFHADNIYAALIASGKLWLGTEKGIAIANVVDLLSQRPQFDFLTKRNGLAGNKIEALSKSNTSIWAVATEGISVIPISFAHFANKRPHFYFEAIRANGRKLEESAEIRLQPNENNIQLSFGFISFNNQNIFLRYRLSKNENWITTTDKVLLFPSLAPGNYGFDLQYSTDNIHWITAAETLKFVISKPWWNQWYTYLTGVVALAVLGFLYFQYWQSIYRQRNHYLKIINEHQQRLIQSEVVALERERNRISKELHDRVGTNLTAIKLTVSRLLQQYREPVASDVEEQFQIAIREIKEIIYALTPPSLERYGLFTGLKNYIGKLHKTIPINISLKTFGKDRSANQINIIIFRVLQELITNSIKHSFAKNITIHINSFDDILNIVYEDDGVGFVYDPTQSGLGLDSIESRIQSVNGSLKFDSGKFGVSYTIDIPVTNNKEVA
jgi:signal transduction histidine kinase